MRYIFSSTCTNGLSRQSSSGFYNAFKPNGGGVYSIADRSWFHSTPGGIW